MRLIFTIALLSLFASCGSDEPPQTFCDFVECLNGGECNGVSCDCPLGYEGIDCALQINPTTIEITGITLHDFDVLDIEGNEWDSKPEDIFPALPDTSFPDVFFSLSNNTGVIYSNQANVLNAEPGMDTELKILGGELILMDWDIEHKITLLDLDRNGAIDLMDQVTFYPYNSTNNFPESVEVSNASTSFTVHLSYNF